MSRSSAGAVIAERAEGQQREGERMIPLASRNRVGAVLPEDAGAIDVIHGDEFAGEGVGRAFRREFAGLELKCGGFFVGSE